MKTLILLLAMPCLLFGEQYLKVTINGTTTHPTIGSITIEQCLREAALDAYSHQEEIEAAKAKKIRDKEAADELVMLSNLINHYFQIKIAPTPGVKEITIDGITFYLGDLTTRWDCGFTCVRDQLIASVKCPKCHTMVKSEGSFNELKVGCRINSKVTLGEFLSKLDNYHECKPLKALRK